MIVFEIITPGAWLDYPDKNWTWKIQNQLRSLESQFFEANLALNLFNNAREADYSNAEKSHIDRDFQLRNEIQRAVEQELGQLPGYDWDAVRFEADIRFKRLMWVNGAVPREFDHNLPFIYARTFLYALDAFDKFLKVLSGEDNVPPSILAFHNEFSEAFPKLRGVRNTDQHLEDRSRGLGAGRNPQPLDLKPIDNALIHAPNGGVLVLRGLNGTKYGSTMSDGHFGEIDVSVESMKQLQRILQGILSSFVWRGPKQHAPNV